MSHEYEFAWKLGEYFLTIAKHMRSRGGSEVAGALGAETVSQLLYVCFVVTVLLCSDGVQGWRGGVRCISGSSCQPIIL